MRALTPSQRAVVAATGTHLLVEAGAGSGKTTTVVQAICHQLGVPVAAADPPLEPVVHELPLDAIAAITFTNQAAADLKRKLRGALRAGGRRDLAAEVDSARIGTIHAFCGDLLRTVALRAGTPAARRILEEGDTGAMLAECAYEALLEAAGGGSEHEVAPLLAGRRVRDVTTWVAQLAEDSDRLRRLGDAPALREPERVLIALAERALALRHARLERENALDFDEMIVAVRRVLRDDQIRRFVQRDLRLLVLDEAQDADPVQREIAFLLGGLVTNDPSPTRIILVGDPKQSIYRFRRADVTQWNEAAATLAARGGRVQPLTDNFRSKAAILAFVDATVGPMLDAPIADDGTRRQYEVPYAPLTARAGNAAGDHAVELMVVPPRDDGKTRNAADVRDVDARGVARRITELHADGRAYGDIAILLAGWGDVERYTDALARAGIPYYLLRAEGFWEAREVLDCVLALRVVRDPGDDVALAGFLKSPFASVRDETLLTLARRQRPSLWDALCGDGGTSAEPELLTRARALVDELRGLRDRVSVATLLERLFHRTGMLATAALSERGDQRVANLRKLLRLAAGARDRSLGEFLREVASARDRAVRVAPERLYRERSAVVTITSVHSAKGLEWPVVFWSDLVRAGKPASANAFLVGRDRISIKDPSLVDDKGKSQDVAHLSVAAEIDRETLAEQYRLWYVAATRAKDTLILTGIPLGNSAKGDSAAQMFRAQLPPLDAARTIAYTGRDGLEYHATVHVTTEDQAAGTTSATTDPRFTLPPAPAVVPAGRARLSASQLMAFERSHDLWWTRHVLRFEGAGREDVTRAVANAVATGSLTHAVLERLEQSGMDIGEVIEDVLAGWPPAAGDLDSALTRTMRAHVRERAEAAIASPAWRAISAIPAHERELAFTRILADGSAMTGAMDLAAIVGGTARILDVKATADSAAAAAARYAIQAAVYADAMRAIADARQVEFTFLTVPAGEVAPVAPDGDVAQLVRRVRAYRPHGAP